MGIRGPKSAAELSVVVVDVNRRPPAKPPAELSDAQAQVWRDAAASMPGGWLARGAYPILVAYCRHTCRARLLEARAAEFQVEWIKAEGGLERLDKILAMAERETRALTACARALRLTPQAQMHARTAARRAESGYSNSQLWEDAPPWPDEQEDDESSKG